jgi:CRP-like cAMP-binding protein
VSPHRPRQNLLLAALPEEVSERLNPQLELVPMPAGKVIYECGPQQRHVYFPTTSVVSLMDNGAELALVGNEGIVGIALFMGGKTTPSQAIVQSAGFGFRLGARALQDEFHRAGPLLDLVVRYSQALIAQVAQTVICNRDHALEQQLCRWLLSSLDRQHSDDGDINQELVATMLGSTVEAVAEAASRLQSAGLIQFSRGLITVTDRAAMEQASCGCYAQTKREFGRLLPDLLAA